MRPTDLVEHLNIFQIGIYMSNDPIQALFFFSERGQSLTKSVGESSECRQCACHPWLSGFIV